ncbi:MAG TPA: UPF0149 family protein [Stellaceae bacterium]|nr:UPF0149 family protein [Stellaceae bacterium]
MSKLDVPVRGDGLEVLEAFLESDRSPPDSMVLSDLDGFLTAIAIGPDLIKPSEWLPVIWGDDEPVFADEAETQAILGSILDRYNEILHDIPAGHRLAPGGVGTAARVRGARLPALPDPGAVRR